MTYVARAKRLVWSIRFSIFISLICATIFYIRYCQFSPRINQIAVREVIKLWTNATSYLVHSSKCRIPEVLQSSADSEKYFLQLPQCSSSPYPLSYATVENNTGFVHLNESVRNSFYMQRITCWYKDRKVLLKELQFKGKVAFVGDYVEVYCGVSTHTYYENVHLVILKDQKIMNKIEKSKKREKHQSVLLIAIDSVSRLCLKSRTPKTYSYLKNNGWYEMQGLNKVGDNTFANIIPMLTGSNEARVTAIYQPHVKYMDDVPFIWKRFSQDGYVTAYGEDTVTISSFAYAKKGFRVKPTDYYFQPYIAAAENLRDNNIICSGAENTGERMMNIVRDFVGNFKGYPYFGLFWMNSFTHETTASIREMDTPILKFLKDLEGNGVLNETVVLFFSDHGSRYGDNILTHRGWLEARLPFFFIHVPDTFPTHQLAINQNRLISFYDVYMTLQDILGMNNKDLNVQSTPYCPSCKSLFLEAEKERSCADAGISPHWCTCHQYDTLSPKGIMVQAAVQFLFNELLNTIFSDKDGLRHCQVYELYSILQVQRTSSTDGIASNDTFLMIAIRTYPKADFQGTLKIETSGKTQRFVMQGDISRLDRYGLVSNCVNEAKLKEYCYCKNVRNGKILRNWQWKY